MKKVNRSFRVSESLNKEIEEFKTNFAKTYRELSNNDLLELLLNSAKREYKIKTSVDTDTEEKQTHNVKGFDLADLIIKAALTYNEEQVRKGEHNLYYITLSSLEKQCGIFRQSAKNAIEHNKKLIEQQAKEYNISTRTNLVYRGKKDENGRLTILNTILKFGNIELKK